MKPERAKIIFFLVYFPVLSSTYAINTKGDSFYFSDVDLDGSSVLSVDKLVGNGALSGDVWVDQFAFIVVSSFSIKSNVAHGSNLIP